MSMYFIECIITEKNVKEVTVTVEASSPGEAEEKFRNQYKLGNYNNIIKTTDNGYNSLELSTKKIDGYI